MPLLVGAGDTTAAAQKSKKPPKTSQKKLPKGPSVDATATEGTSAAHGGSGNGGNGGNGGGVVVGAPLGLQDLQGTWGGRMQAFGGPSGATTIDFALRGQSWR